MRFPAKQTSEYCCWNGQLVYKSSVTLAHIDNYENMGQAKASDCRLAQILCEYILTHRIFM